MAEKLYLDLSTGGQKTQNYKRLLIFGGMFIIAVSIIGMVFWIVEGMQDWKSMLSPFTNVLIGVVLILRASDKTIKWMRQYILLDNEKVELKLEPFQKKKVLKKKDIESVEFRTSKIVLRGDNQLLELPYSMINYHSLQKLKHHLQEFKPELNQT